jgi:diguanylate cyclase (GGDEF)-like protein
VARLTEALVAISPGSKARLAVDDKHAHDEIGLLTKSANALLDTAEKAINEIQVQHDQMKMMATHDSLTELPTMRLAADRLQVAISSARRTNEQVALLFLDLDAFKAVNDTFGHDAGDALLQEVAQRLRKSIRDEDTAARIGGDEFLVILSGLQGRSAAATVAEKIVAAVSLPVAFAGHSLRVGASIGIALFPEHGVSMEALRQAADCAMYRVKKAGKNGFVFAGPC